MIHIVCALKAEAQPLIQALRLKGRSEAEFPIYENRNTRLIISGLGKVAAAAAVSYLHMWSGREARAWLNFGLAGHAEAERGELYAIHKVMDGDSGECWYPCFCFDTDLPRTSLVSVSRVENDYDQAMLYDMEAAGFMATATRFVTTERTHCLKLVSDNRREGVEQVNAEMAQGMISRRLDEIVAFIDALRDLEVAEEGREAEEAFAAITARWHFSQYQQKQLRRLLQRWYALKEQVVWCDELAASHGASAVLAWLDERLTDQWPEW